jgi:hypothetical protein
MIVGLTNEKDGSPRLHRTVTTKIAIGLPPDDKSNYPKKLDHFVFLKQVMVDNKMQWVVDQEKQDHFGADCKNFWIVFLDDDVDTVFRTELAAYVKTRCWCRGDGERAQRRKQVGEEWPPKGDFQIYKGACGNNGCKDFEPQNGKPAACKPSADLYFMLGDYPTLGTICRIHTSSYQSIRQIHSALLDLQAVTGGRLMGVRAKLFVMPARNVFEQNGVEKTGTKFVLGLELAAKDIPELMTQMASTSVMFQGLQKQLAGRVLEVEEDDEERAPEIAAEFYHDKSESQVVKEDPEAALKQEADTLMREKFPAWNEAKRMMKIGQYEGKMPELIEKLKKVPTPEGGASRPTANTSSSPVALPPSSADQGKPRSASSAENSQPSSATTGSRSETSVTPKPVTSESAMPAQPTSGQTETTVQTTPTKPNLHGVEITDDDFPEGMFDKEAKSEAVPQAVQGGKKKQTGFNF